MSLIHRSKKPVAPSTPIAEPYQEESGQARRARVEAQEKAEADAQDARVKKSMSDAAKVNAAYFEREGALAKQAAEQNAKNRAAQRTQADINSESAAAGVTYPYRAYDKATDIDPLMDREPEYVQKAHGYVPPKRKPSITLQPQPDERFAPALQPARIKTEAELVQEKEEAQARMAAHLARRNQ